MIFIYIFPVIKNENIGLNLLYIKKNQNNKVKQKIILNYKKKYNNKILIHNIK